MKANTSLLSIIFFLILAAGSQTLAQPKMEIPEGTTHDFGTIYKGQNVTHHFLIKNSGTDTLVINGVAAGCGCTAALVASRQVPPDSTTELNVTFSSGAFYGTTMKNVTLSTNDPKTPSTVVYIKSNVVSVLEATGSFVFNLVKADSLYRTTVKLKNVIDRPLKILSVSAGWRGVEAKIDKELIKPGESAELQVSLFYKGGWVRGITGGEVVLKTDFKPQPEHMFHVVVNVGI